MSEAGSCRGSPCLHEVDSFLYEDQGTDENGDTSSIHLFPTRISKLAGEAQHPCWAVYTQDWGQVCTKGRELGDFF